MMYKLCDDTWDDAEKKALQRVIDSNMFSMGKEVAEFEKDFSEKFNVSYSVMASSGSTANLLAIAALVYSGRLQKGDEVLVTAVSWSTTYFPLFQLGLKIRFVDIDSETLNISMDKLEKAITDKTRMIFVVNLLGNPNDFNRLKDICTRHNLFYIEDNCESLGATFENKQAGTYGLIGTYSTFFSHHLCTMEGGVAVTDDEELYHYMLSIRAHGWTRNLPKNSKIYQKKENSFYESFNFIVPGFNLRPLEMEGALGIEQLKKMDNIIAQRQKNAMYFKERAKSFNHIKIQKEIGKSSWFGFALVLTEPNKRNDIVEFLANNDIEVRPIVAGNFTRNPVITYLDYSISGSLENADYIHDNGFFVGNHSKDTTKEIDYLFELLEKKL